MSLKNEYIMNNFYKKAFKEDNIPDEIKRASIQICNAYNIKGICDPVYIGNVIINCINNIDKKG